MRELSHLDSQGRASMVDVTAKDASERTAWARAVVRMAPETLALIMAGGLPKGDVLAVARIAGIQAAKRTSDLIPLCHPLALTHVQVDFRARDAAGELEINAGCRLTGRTGVEMEALTAAAVAALTVYDMCKAVQRDMVLAEIRLLRKEGGKTGPWQAPA